MLSRERPPSYSQSHDPHTIDLPSVPKTQPPASNHETVSPTSPFAPSDTIHRPAEPTEVKQAAWPSTNPLTAYYQPGSLHTSPSTRSTMLVDSPSAMDIDATAPDNRFRRGGSVLSIDDPDVRLAAEALGDLRAGKITTP
jgi:hypothetical protein